MTKLKTHEHATSFVTLVSKVFPILARAIVSTATPLQTWNQDCYYCVEFLQLTSWTLYSHSKRHLLIIISLGYEVIVELVSL